MDAKEFLEQATVLNEKINMDFLHRQKLKELLEQISGGSVALHDRVQGGQLPDSPATKLVDKITDLDHLIEQELAEYDVVLEQIKAAIATCGEYNEIRILQERYLKDEKWSIISQAIGLSERMIFNLHNSALLKIENYLAQSNISVNFSKFQ